MATRAALPLAGGFEPPLPSSVETVSQSNHRDTDLFTIHFYLLLSPTQVGDARRVRALTYWYRVGSVIVCRH